LYIGPYSKVNKKIEKILIFLIFFAGTGSFFQKADFWPKNPSLALLIVVQPDSA